jgi:hypothetical protein
MLKSMDGFWVAANAANRNIFTALPPGIDSPIKASSVVQWLVCSPRVQ